MPSVAQYRRRHNDLPAPLAQWDGALPALENLVSRPLQKRRGITVATTEYAGKTDAPEFPTGLDWLNIDRPLSKADLRGKLVILDFWTYC